MKTLKAQTSIEITIILAATIALIGIFSVIYFTLISSSVTTLKNSNTNLITNLEYENQTSIFIIMSQSLPLSTFNLSIDNATGYHVYNYTVSQIAKSNFGTVAVIANSVLNYPEYNYTNLCSLNYKSSSHSFSIVKNCTSWCKYQRKRIIRVVWPQYWIICLFSWRTWK